MYKLMRLRRRRINSVPLGPKLHTTTSTPLVSKYQNRSSSEMVPQWGTIFFSLTVILISTKSFFKIFLSIALTNASSHSVLVKELNSSPVGTNYFFYRGTFWSLPLVTGVGFNFVSTGDEVRPRRKFHIFAKRGFVFRPKPCSR